MKQSPLLEQPMSRSNDTVSNGEVFPVKQINDIGTMCICIYSPEMTPQNLSGRFPYPVRVHNRNLVGQSVTLAFTTYGWRHHYQIAQISDNDR